MTGVMIHVTSMQLDDGPNRLVAYLERPPLPGRATRTLGTAVADFALAAGPESVKRAGELLYARLAGHAEFQTALTPVPVGADRCPVYVHLDADGEADRIPWEVLCAPTGLYFGLEQRWSVARVVDSLVKLPGTIAFRPPLRIAVFLSCLGIPAEEEWAGLMAAVDEATQLPIEILAFVGEPDLEDKIAQEARPNVTVTAVPGPEDLDEMQARVARFRPHVLHFFCHGSIRDKAHLELASQADWIEDSTVSALSLEPAQVAALGDVIERPWLAVLNCCEGAAAEGEIHSLASDLVYTGGLAAAVGMREPIASDDAHEFSKCLYPDLFDRVGRIVSGESGPLDWSELLVRPRRRLVQRQGGVFSARAADRREWTLPVLYLRPDEFVVAGARAPAPADLVSLEVLRSLRATTTGPPTYVADLDRLISELEQRVARS
jgi:hypothetical protein